MSKRLTILIIASLTLFSIGVSQYGFESMFHRVSGGQPHGVVVAPDNRIWVAYFGRTGDSLDNRALSSIHVLNPDGTPAPFSPIQIVSVSGTPDTLFHLGGSGGSRGINVDADGNILYCHFDRLYRINYQTGLGMNKAVPKVGASLTMASAADNGDIIVGHVANGNPIYVYDTDFNLVGNVDTTSKQLSRNLIVSPDGNNVYHGSVAGPGILVYHSDAGTFGPYTLVDTLSTINFAECFAWSKDDPNVLWTSSRDNFTTFTKGTWYAYNVTNKALVDSFKWHLGDVDSLGTPRGISFTSTGDTVYVAGFDGHSVQRFVLGAVSVERDNNGRPTGYDLAQNYPNPFNPSTEIRFSITSAGNTKLVVYDMLGREIQTLVNEYLSPGAYRAQFTAGTLSSGTYVYVLTSGSIRLTKKMVLMK